MICEEHTNRQKNERRQKHTEPDRHGTVFGYFLARNGYGKIEYVLRENNFPILNTQFAADVEINTVIPSEDMEGFEKSIADKTAGAAKITWENPVKYDILDGQLLTF